MDVIEVNRGRAADVPKGLGFRAGVAKVELTPPLGSWTAGWGPGVLPRKATRLVGRIYGRVLVLDDGAGERVAFVTLDLHAGTRFLAEKIGALTTGVGLNVGRVVLVGAHNHAGPGNLYASPYYDAFCTSFPWVRGFHRELAEDLSTRIAQAVGDACARLEPATAHWGVSSVWEWTANRSLGAAIRNFRGQSVTEIRARLSALHGAPPTLSALERLLVDPRVQTLVARRVDGTPLGAFSTFGAHDSLIAREHGALGGDWFGVAQETAEALLTTKHQRPTVVGLGAGAIGDADPRPPGTTLAEVIARRQKSLKDNLLMVKEHGARLGAALVEAVDRALSSPPLTGLTVRFAEPTVQNAMLEVDGHPARLPDQPRIGASTLAGSELGPGFLTEGLVDEDPAHAGDPHFPKIDDDLGMRVIQPVLDVLKFQSPQLPLRLVTVGDVAVLGLPGEPTTWLSQGLGELVRQRTGVRQVMIAGTCGEYAGYLTTAREYEQQHYEGASTIWGRYTEPWLRSEVGKLSAAVPSAPSGSARFIVERFTGVVRRSLSAHRVLQPHVPAPLVPPRVQRVGGLLRFSGGLKWGAEAAVPVFEWGEWIKLERVSGMPLPIEPQVVLDELGNALWWSIELADWRDVASQQVMVVLAHPAGEGRFPILLPAW